MPRTHRVLRPHIVHHVISRFVDGQYRLCDQEERAEYLRRLGRAAEASEWLVLGFALMSNHLHLCVIAGRVPFRDFIHPVHSVFGRWLNDRQRRRGALFAGRPTTIALEAQDTLRLLAYIHNNPVRAGVVPRPAASNWTSHLMYLEPSRAPAWLRVDKGLALCGMSRGDFGAYADAHAADPRDGQLSGDGATRVRTAVRTVAPAEVSDPALVRGRLVYGIDVRPMTPVAPGLDVSPDQVIDAVVARSGVRRHLLVSRARRRDVVEARRLTVLVWRSLGRPAVEVASSLGVGSAAAAQLVSRRPERVAGLAAEVEAILHDLAGSAGKVKK